MQEDKQYNMRTDTMIAPMDPQLEKDIMSGKTVFERHLREKAEVKKKAYRLLTEYDEETIRTAIKIIDDVPAV